MRQRPNLAKITLHRRTLLQGLLGLPALDAGKTEARQEQGRDPVAALYADWLAAKAEWEVAFARAQEIEGELVRRIGYPRVKVLRRAHVTSWATTPERIEELLERRRLPFEKKERLRRELHAKLHRAQVRWNEEALRSGLRAAEDIQNQAWEKWEGVSHALIATRARSLAGIRAKLLFAAALAKDEGYEEDEFPRLHLESLLADFKAL